MSRRSVFQALVVAIGVLLLADRMMEHASLHSVPRQVIATIGSAPQSIDVPGIGNSLIAAGFVPAAVQSAFKQSGQSCTAINGGLGASGVIEHLALTRLALRQHTVKILVYGFFDQQLSSDIVKTNADIVGNHSMLYYQEPELTLQYAPFNLLDRLNFEVYRSCALLRERNTLWFKVEKLRRTVGMLGLPAVETNRFGRKSDFTLLEASDTKTFTQACNLIIQSGRLLSAPFLALVQEARSKGVKVIVVEMPMHPSHLKQFYSSPAWKVFSAKTRAAVNSNGVTYLDASEWIPSGDLFSDHLHLSAEGADRFSRLLAGHLIQFIN